MLLCGIILHISGLFDMRQRRGLAEIFLQESFHFADFHFFLIKGVYNIKLVFKAHASQTFECNQWLFYLMDFSSNFEVNFYPCFIFL